MSLTRENRFGTVRKSLPLYAILWVSLGCAAAGSSKAWAIDGRAGLQLWRAGQFQALATALQADRQNPSKRTPFNGYWIAACLSRLPGRSQKAANVLRGLKKFYDLNEASAVEVNNAIQLAQNGQPINLVYISCEIQSSRRQMVIYTPMPVGRQVVRMLEFVPGPDEFFDRQMPKLPAVGDLISTVGGPAVAPEELIEAADISAETPAAITAAVTEVLGNGARSQTSAHFVVSTVLTPPDLDLARVTADLESTYSFLAGKLGPAAPSQRIFVYIAPDQAGLAVLAQMAVGQHAVTPIAGFCDTRKSLIAAQRPIEVKWRMDAANNAAGKQKTILSAATDYDALESFLIPSVAGTLLANDYPDAPAWLQRGLLAYAGKLQRIDGQVGLGPLPGILKSSPLALPVDLNNLWTTTPESFGTGAPGKTALENMALNFVLYLDSQAKLAAFYARMRNSDLVTDAGDPASVSADMASAELVIPKKDLSDEFRFWFQTTRGV